MKAGIYIKVQILFLLIGDIGAVSNIPNILGPSVFKLLIINAPPSSPVSGPIEKSEMNFVAINFMVSF